MVMLREEILSASIEREPFPILVLVGCVLFSILLFIAHLSFRLGKPEARWHHSGHMRGVHVLWGFSALPGGMAFGAGFSLGLVDWIFRPEPPVIPWPYLPFIAVAISCGIWAFKEFQRPTLSRTPPWLHELMKRDHELRAAVYGNRSYR